MSEELKPCPFCGGEASIWLVPFKKEEAIITYGMDYQKYTGHEAYGMVDLYQIRCRKCHSGNPIKLTREEAIIAWNKRKGETE